MKYLATISVALVSISCASVKDINLEFYGNANNFFQSEKKAYLGHTLAETSLVRMGSDIITFFSDSGRGEYMARANLGVTGYEWSDSRVVVENGSRFTYVFKHGDILYNASTRVDGVYLMSSSDGEEWAELGRILSKSDDPNSKRFNLWNPAIAVDHTGTWHLLVEAADYRNQNAVGLIYATTVVPTTPSYGSINFDSTVSNDFVIEGGGNPWVTHIKGKGLLVIHGYIWKPIEPFTNHWYTTASTFDGVHWTTHADKFRIGVYNIHVCDPHAIEVNGDIILNVGVDQAFIYKTHARNETFESLWIKLLGDYNE